jgi:hypothetical protein
MMLAAALLIVLVSLSLFLIFKKPGKQVPAGPFYVGVEFAYGSQFSQLKALVDKVENYTNLFVIGSIELTYNQTALDESCNYIVKSGLNFIVLFTTDSNYNYSLFNWILNARQVYGDQFLGIYKYDEPGGDQLDGRAMYVNDTGNSYPDNPTGYAEAAQNYISNLGGMTNDWLNYTNRIFTSDYGLYWFDYNSSYTAVFGEFLENQNNTQKQLIIALDRGAAESFNRDWGVTITYNSPEPPYLENGTVMLQDMQTAYNAGANYIIVFNYPTYPATNRYGILSQDQFNAIENFWNQIHSNPGSFDSSKAQVAYVVPENYGFGFRNPSDTIWGLFPADGNSSKIYNDAHFLLGKYGTNLNIIYDQPGIINPTLKNYEKVYYWNQTIT